MREQFDEKELEDGLLNHIQNFLLELGAGFAFLGRQYKLTVGGEDFYADLLFYHTQLRCYVVVELKANKFSLKDLGQLHFYQSVIDGTMRQPGDNKTIGLLLCKTKNKIVAEYALSDIDKPIGISEFDTKLLASLPENYKGSLPTVEEIEKELEDSLF